MDLHLNELLMRVEYLSSLVLLFGFSQQLLRYHEYLFLFVSNLIAISRRRATTTMTFIDTFVIAVWVEKIETRPSLYEVCNIGLNVSSPCN